MELREALRKISVLQEASPASRAAFLSAAVLRSYKKGEHLFLDKEKVEAFSFLVSGYISLYKVGHNQEKKVIFVCSGGELINEVMIQEEYASVNAETLTDCMVVSVGKREMQRMMAEDYLFAEAVMKSMAVKIRRLYHQLKNTPNSVRLDKQIAAKMWKLSRDYGVLTEEGVEIDFDITVSFLADMVGAKRETVSRQLKVLMDEGLVVMKKKRFIIPDRENLVNYIKKA